MTSKKRRIISFLLSIVMVLSIFSGIFTIVYAAEEIGEVCTVEYPRGGGGTPEDWGHPPLEFIGGWRSNESDNFAIRSINSYSGQVAYCIEPGVSIHTGDELTNKDENYWENYPDNLNPTIDPDTIKIFIGRILQYGYTGNNSVSLDVNDAEDQDTLALMMATQILIWETIVGERDEYFNLVSASEYGKDPIFDMISTGHPFYSKILASYNSIVKSVKNHTVAPSFMAKSKATAKTYELEWNGSEYILELVDTNGVLSNYTFSSSTSDVSVKKSGNKLIISATKAPASEVEISATKGSQRMGLVMWADGNINTNKTGQVQDLVTWGERVSDPVYAFLKLNVSYGEAKIVKKSEDGNISGINFRISGNGVDKIVTTQSNGTVTVSNLSPGKYTVSEVTDDSYTPQTPQTVTVVSGQTGTVTFSNTLKRGGLKVIKSSEDNMVEGVKFHLYGTSLTGDKVDEYAITDASGIATFDNVLISGNTPYTLEEINTSEKYVLPVSQSVTVNWNEISERRFNNVLKKFRVTVTKYDIETGTSQGDASLAGAKYGLYKNGKLIAEYVTDSNGSFITDYYVCDTGWTIKEISPSSGYLLDESTHEIPVDAGEYNIELNAVNKTVNEQVVKGNIRIVKHIDEEMSNIETASVTDNTDIPMEDIEADAGSGIIEQPEEGAKFQIFLASAGNYDTAEENERDILVTDSDGFAVSKNLPYGRYRVHQIEGKDGHKFAPDFTVFICENGKTYSYILNNQSTNSFIRVEKRDAESKKIIASADIGFQIRDLSTGELISQTVYYPKPESISTFYTNDEGWLMLPCSLNYGQYELIEVQTPDGYVLDRNPVSFTVDGSAGVVTVEKYNKLQKGFIKIQKTGEIFSSVLNSEDVYQPVYEEKGLAGAVYEITAAEDIVSLDGTVHYKEGELVDTVTTNSEGWAKSKLLYLGKFLVTELTAPENMVLNRTSQNVELVYAGQEIEVTEVSTGFYNDRQTVQISLTKSMETDDVFDIGNRDEISSVTFGLFAAADITASDGTVIPAGGLIEIISVSQNGYAECKTNVPFGSYYLKELTTDGHYILNDRKYPVDFVYSGQDIAVVKLQANEGKAITNELIYGSVSGKKSDDEGNALSGAVIGLFAANEGNFTEKTAFMVTTSGADGSFFFENVPKGHWFIREIEQPVGYVICSEIFPIVIETDEQVVEINITNEKIRGNLALNKIDSEYPDNKLSGAEFEVYRDINNNKELDDEDVLLGLMNEGEPGFYEMLGIEFGGVLVREKTAPVGYYPDEGVYHISVEDNNKTYVIENNAGLGFINEVYRGNLKIVKSSSDDTVAGFSFRIVGEDYDRTFTTDENGIILIENLRVGKYVVTELEDEHSSGYMLPEPVTVELLTDEMLTVDIHNEKITVTVEKIPETGGINTPWFCITALIISAVGVVICNRKNIAVFFSTRIKKKQR